MSFVASSNPALSAIENQPYGYSTTQTEHTATLTGVVHKTGILTGIAVLSGGAAYSYLPVSSSIMIMSCIAAMVVCFGVGWVIAGNPSRAPIAAPIYAVVEGVFLGMVTKSFDYYLRSLLIAEAGGATQALLETSLALPAFVITVSCVCVMLALYSFRIIQPTKRFVAVLYTATGAIALTYLAMFVLSMFGIRVPYISIGSALEGGQAAMIGMGFNLVVLGLASFMLIIDFGRVEDILRSRQPAYMEWYAGFALLVTIAWIYYEAVKLAFRLALLMNRRD